MCSYPLCSLSFAIFASAAALAVHFASTSTSPTSAIDYVVVDRMLSPGVRSANPIRPSGNRVHALDLSETRSTAAMADTISGPLCNFKTAFGIRVQWGFVTRPQNGVVHEVKLKYPTGHKVLSRQQCEIFAKFLYPIFLFIWERSCYDTEML